MTETDPRREPPSFPTASPGSPFLEARRVTKRFGATTALLEAGVQVARGERVALVGESGSGKTTLLRCFNRMVTPDAGTILLDGEPLAQGDAVELRRSVGYVQQEGGLLPHWTVLRNASLVPRLRGMEDAGDRGREALDLVGLPSEEFGARWPRELSGGQRQRVALARALAARPEVVLLDEPFGALDALTRHELQSSFVELAETLGVTVLLVTHDLEEAFRLTHRTVVLQAGRVEAAGTPSELRRCEPESYTYRLLRKAGVA